MALIKCPECGKEVSDKAPACIHCGCPLEQKIYEVVNGVTYDISFLKDPKIDFIQKIKMIREQTGCGLKEGKEIADKYCPYEQRKQYTLEAHASKLPKCPICGSTNLSKISIIKTGMKIGAFGLLGAGDVGKTWKCNNCGSKF